VLLRHVIVPGNVGRVVAGSGMAYASDAASLVDVISLGP